MERIVVANLYRLGKDGDSFSKDFKKLVRSKAKITEDYVKQINANWIRFLLTFIIISFQV